MDVNFFFYNHLKNVHWPSVHTRHSVLQVLEIQSEQKLLTPWCLYSKKIYILLLLDILGALYIFQYRLFPQLKLFPWVKVPQVKLLNQRAWSFFKAPNTDG